MEEGEEEIERNINNITCDNSFQSPVDMNIQKKDAKFSLEKVSDKYVTLDTRLKFWQTGKDENQIFRVKKKMQTCH